MKILYVTTISATMGFFVNYITELVKDGHIVELACNCADADVHQAYRELGCKVYDIAFSRSPLSFINVTACKRLKKIVEENNYDIVHCHTPVAAAGTRIVCRKARKNGARVFYTAHGFHFYKGAPLKNWLIFYPIEKICSYFTDVLITINKEDYALAQKKMKAKKIEYVPGVGIDIEKFKNIVVDKGKKREEVGVSTDAKLLVSVGELNANKNHETVIRAIAKLNDKNIHYAIAGDGVLMQHLKEVAAECGIESNVHLLGRRIDVAEIYKVADIYIHPSFREGLPVALMEAMASGLPCIVSKIRGNVDIVDEKCGLLFNPHDIDECGVTIKLLLNHNSLKNNEHKNKKIQSYSVDIINKKIMAIYCKR